VSAEIALTLFSSSDRGRVETFCARFQPKPQFDLNYERLVFALVQVRLALTMLRRLAPLALICAAVMAGESVIANDMALADARALEQSMSLVAVFVLGLGAILWTVFANRAANRHAKEIEEANAKLRCLVIELNNEILQRTAIEEDLIEAKNRAEDSNRSKSQFLANMSHELRTPLNAILGFADMMRMEILGPLGNASYREYARDIHESGVQLLSILTDLLDMARIEAGKVTLEETEFDLAETVKDCLKTYRDHAKASRKRLDFDGVRTIVRADERLLRQVLINLITNALKFTDAEGSILASLARKPTGLDIVVHDTGCGIPADKIELIMEPFGQVADAFARTKGGIGLGLPIVKALTELHGGKFTIESEVGLGTTARIHLPAERILASEMSVSERLAS
jgi:signal transduction histidine kinase